jgi:bifunctional DNA-binding transcriptional regulator/antitoxin component of YhaV-PrlF toxin-antitoxin module
MKTTFETVIRGDGNNAGIEVPPENLAQLGGSKRPPVVVTIGTYSYRSTAGVVGGRTMISLPKAHRDASGLKAGDDVTVTLTLDAGPRPVAVPPDLAAALENAGLTATFDGLAYSRRKEFARLVADAKAEATRARRVEKILTEVAQA